MVKQKILILISGILLFWGGQALAQFPTQLGGFTLEEDISVYEKQVQMSTCRAMARIPYLSEGEMEPRPGIKSGLVTYGLCDRPKKILRIKLKAKDDSKAFFDILFDRYSQKFGVPDEYKGDPFQTVVAWKWSFVNDDDERISLILQHNKMVADEKKGTAVKITLTSQMEREKACYKKRRTKIDRSLNHRDSQLSQEDKVNLFIPH